MLGMELSHDCTKGDSAVTCVGVVVLFDKAISVTAVRYGYVT